ncbi:hypothetical protein [Vibrio metschnikovii]|uniref:hypothetical protein n=1 Tax=Vibrio metschnikovii TaxID=28172 RepID=UPI001C308A9A|nr:hypothetical protein [Vibrio metschnikovii]
MDCAISHQFLVVLLLELPFQRQLKLIKIIRYIRAFGFPFFGFSSILITEFSSVKFVKKHYKSTACDFNLAYAGKLLDYLGNLLVFTGVKIELF